MSGQQQQQQLLGTPGDLPLLLDGVRIVLVSPKTPANIGSVLRVAENFEVGAAAARVSRACGQHPCSTALCTR